ncbi:hypothetical protein GCM10010495_50350 [Kitasatospora herbaricolor]|uniref:DUF4153 domain-containing protein n=1 Tax=Kitasatospora herbaricolor TaxID=68217 RepID=UPI0017495B37|nr:DUF4173 domain-containing protein [Kitasatospora herbaricolor]MDQ0310890.1 hypothetical protein [Kitasatospora herbaricolor]GGV28139.1 hypothetical protein GCM10010495_50350 [Kitasatospora herbaricolor]
MSDSSIPEPSPGTPSPADAHPPVTPEPAVAGAGFAEARPADPFAAPFAAPPVPPGPQPFRPQPLPPNRLMAETAPARRSPATLRVLLAAVAAGLLAAWLLGEGVGVNLLICALAATATAGLSARAAGRRVRPWTVLWSVLAAVVLVVPVLSDAGWPTFLAVASSLGLASLALHGGRRWTGVTLALPGFLWHLVPSLPWALQALRGRDYPARDKVVPILKATAVAVVLLIVFGALFASADVAMGDVLSNLTPSVELDDLPARFLRFVLGTVLVLGFAHLAAGPRVWDRATTKPGRERGRLEWALPLTALNLMFATFTVIQVVVLAGGRDAITKNTGMSRSEYARQGFWQLMVITVLTLGVVALAKRWAPRSTPADHRLTRALLGTLCVLTLVVVGSALLRMSYYVDASGLTTLRLWVLVVEIWLGVVFLLVIAAGVLRSGSWLPRAVVLSAAVTAAVYGLMGPDAMVAEQNVARYEKSPTRQIDLRNVRDLSLDAVPALDRLPEDLRTCALQEISRALADGPAPWYATSLAESRAREILERHPIGRHPAASCSAVGFKERYSYDY